MDVVWLDGAVADLKDIEAYLSEADPERARSFAADVYGAARRLEQDLRQGCDRAHGAVRSFDIRGQPFVVIYRLHRGRAEALAVRRRPRAERPAVAP